MCRKLITRLFFGLVLIASLVVSGCYQPVTAPAAEYDQADAEFLLGELSKMDWE